MNSGEDKKANHIGSDYNIPLAHHIMRFQIVILIK